MKITRITSHVLGYDLPEALGYSQQYYNKRTAHLVEVETDEGITCLLYTSPSPRDRQKSRMPSSA